MIGEIGRQLVGLFVDDGLLAAEILVVVALIAGPAALGALPPSVAGLLLTVSLPAVLAASVLRSVRRARRDERG